MTKGSVYPKKWNRPWLSGGECKRNQIRSRRVTAVLSDINVKQTHLKRVKRTTEHRAWGEKDMRKEEF